MALGVLQDLVAGTRVRLKADPGKIGQCTGRKREAGGFTLIEVEFGPNNRSFQRGTQLEIVPEHESMYDLFNSGRFGGPKDLAQIVVTAKLSGDLTNVFYSMEVGNTDFLPHQFRSVLKFIESQRGRILIADEVGLGKTIEAIYIWKELQAREGARRFLVVCPSMLREKWKRDFEIRFGIEAEIVDANELIEKVQSASQHPNSRSFVLIASLEGIRAKDIDWDADSRVARQKLCGILAQTAERSSDSIFDLVVIDEAHYLRNASTASHKTAGLLRENTANLVLLSATPIQTSDENLFNLLSLLSPEDYTNYLTYRELAQSNSILIRLENSIKYKGDVEEARAILEEANNGSILFDDRFHTELENALTKDFLTREERIDLARKIAERSFFSRFISRTRKRDVIENRVIRVPSTYQFSFSEYEKQIYDNVTQYIREKSAGGSTIYKLTLVARQRQMTSSLPAAFLHWRDHHSFDDMLWDDLGVVDFEEGNSQDSVKDDVLNLPFYVDLKQLELNDSKYNELKRQVTQLLLKDPREKLIIFSFYRGTISYLERRLQADGFRTISLMGGMRKDKDRILDDFASPDGPNIFISSEVGAEGIDLQFCHTIINYDLPWNPMKLEQRIGRIDRIGQESAKIYIYNITCLDTIEDQVLLRLYDRIQIFKESIGDLEDILGDNLERLALDLIDPNLTDQERKKLFEQNSLAIIQKRKLRNELEDKAIDFFGFSDYIIRSISDAKKLDRYIGPTDTLGLVEDFIEARYPDTKISFFKDMNARVIRLSPQAKVDFAMYIDRVKPPVSTQLHRSNSDTLCLFDPKLKVEKTNLPVERIDAIHPIIRWIVEENEKRLEDRHPCSAITLSKSVEGVPNDNYLYYIQLWSAVGWKSKKELRFFAASITGQLLDTNDAEKLVVAAFRKGKAWRYWDESISFNAISSALEKLNQFGFSQYAQFEQAFLSENAQICAKQEEYATRTADRKKEELNERIDRLTSEGRTRTIKMEQGRLAKVQAQLDIQKERINRYKNAFTNVIELAIGIIKNGE